MEPPQKREVSILIPFTQEKDGSISIFMQKRDAKARNLPGYFGFFGGGVENGEAPIDALAREIQEELGILIQNAEFFCRFESLKCINNVFSKEVTAGFAQEVTVHEGEYGTFLSEASVLNEKICDSDKLILAQFIKTRKGDFTA